MIKTKCSEYGLCCESCQEDVNVHRCFKCFQRFEDQDIIFCKPHSQSDSEHCHEKCVPINNH